MKSLSLFMVLFASILAAEALQGAEIPYLTGRVTDNAQILTEETIKFLGETLKSHEDRTTNQVVILTVPSLEGENVEDYANKVFNAWKIGQKEKDNGILIVVVPNDRRMRIEVGYGLEETMTDLMAGRIIRNVMTPRFREGDYNGGITDGTRAVLSVLEGRDMSEFAGLADVDDSTEESGISSIESPEMSIIERILIGAFIFGIIGLFTIMGIVTPGFGWFLYFFLIPFWAMFPIIVLGTKGAFICLIIYLVVFPAAKLYLRNTSWYNKAKTDLRTKGRASIGGFAFSSGGSGGSWSSGGRSSSGGGFSGGGGSSGGGGASGGW